MNPAFRCLSRHMPWEPNGFSSLGEKQPCLGYTDKSPSQPIPLLMRLHWAFPISESLTLSVKDLKAPPQPHPI
jgi:hypothetical protein